MLSNCKRQLIVLALLTSSLSFATSMSISSGGADTWRATVPNASLLPVTGNSDGAARIALDTKGLYTYDVITGNWLLVASPAAATALTALTGDVIATGPGAAPATIQSNVVTNAKLAQMAALTVKGNNTGAAANASDVLMADLPISTAAQTALNLKVDRAGDTMTGALTIAGSANTNQLVVKANATQTVPYQSFQKSDATVIGNLGKQADQDALQFLSGTSTPMNGVLIDAYGEGTSGGSRMRLTHYNDGVTANSSVNILLRKYRGTKASPLANNDNDRIGALSFAGYDGTSDQFPADYTGWIDGAPSSGNVPVRLEMNTGSNATNKKSVLQVRSDGRVQVGSVTQGMPISSDTAKFLVGPTSATEIPFKIKMAPSTSVAALSIATSADSEIAGVSNTGEVMGKAGFRMSTSGAQPTCDASTRGLMWNVEGGAGVADIFQICQKDALDAYAWVTH